MSDVQHKSSSMYRVTLQPLSYASQVGRWRGPGPESPVKSMLDDPSSG